MKESDALPTDIEACHTLILQQAETAESLARDYEKLKFELEQLKRYIYGRRSERHVEDDSQLSLFEEAQAAAAEEPPAAAEVIEEEITYRRRRRTKADRFPESLPREIKVENAS